MRQGLISVIKRAFEEPILIAELNATLISFIPKVDVVTYMKQFRPISLCNVSYKIITKILAQRLQMFMTKLVGPYQCPFVPKR